MSIDVFKSFARKNHSVFYIVFRLLVGLLFFMHGMQKLFGVFGGQKVVFFTLFGLAGLIEVLGGLAIFFGIFVRWAALIGGIEMIVAYFMKHVPLGSNPLTNNGELSLLYLAAFCVLFAYGAGVKSKKG
jgi:putative oxidoreductase